MANQNLTALTPTLLEIPAASVSRPETPFAISAQEWADLETLTRDTAIRAKLVTVGLPAGLLDSLATDIDAARAAQSEWVVLRDRRKSAGQRELEDKAYAFRQTVLGACRWNLRHDRVAMGTVSAIAEGEGVADLIQDLSDLAQLIQHRSAAFAEDQTFDAAATVQQARALAGDLQAGVAAEKLTTEQNEAKDLRDRAYTYVAGRVAQIREAGRYAFRDDAALTRKFASAYRRRQRRRYVEDDVEPTPVV